MAKQPAQRPSATPQRPAAAPAPARPSAEKRPSLFSVGSKDMIFGRQHFIIFGVGLLLVLTGLAAMAGGAQPDPNNWDESVIYSARRITLAPILMVAGFVVVIYGIFKKSPAAAE